MEQIEKERIQQSIQQLVSLSGAAELARKIIEPFAQTLRDYFYSTSPEYYQKIGYPLGKTKRGLKKWQYRQMRQGFKNIH